MARPGKLPETEIAARLAAVPGWSVKGGKLHRELTFADSRKESKNLTRSGWSISKPAPPAVNS